MKKILLCLLAGCCTLATMATEYTAYGKIKIKGATSKTEDVLMFFESLAFVNGPAYDDGGDTPEIMSGQQLYFYAVGTDNNYSSYADYKLENIPVVVKGTATDTQYTLTFSNWYSSTGKTYRLWDKQLDSMVNIVNSKTYVFTMTAGTTVADRFILEPFEPETGDLEVCHIGDNLEVKNNPYATNIVVKNEEGTKVIDQMPRSTPQVISLQALPKGRYTVEFNNGAKVFVISVKPDVTPAN